MQHSDAGVRGVLSDPRLLERSSNTILSLTDTP